MASFRSGSSRISAGIWCERIAEVDAAPALPDVLVDLPTNRLRGFEASFEADLVVEVEGGG